MACYITDISSLHKIVSEDKYLQCMYAILVIFENLYSDAVKVRRDI